MQTLCVRIAESPEQAPNYRRDSIDVRAATITMAIVVKNGTVDGKSTVDFQFKDEQGGDYVALLSGDLVQQLAEVVRASES